jgi:hypothetical protein
MVYEFRLPLIVPQMTGGTVECVYAKPGELLKMGSKLLDVSIDLSSAFAQECPPVSFFRVVLRETALLRELSVVPGQHCRVGDILAIFSSDADENIRVSGPRAVRTTIASIMHHDDMWTGNHQ